MHRIITILIPITIFLSACSNSDVAGATDIETGAQIAGILYAPDGSIESGTTVSLIPDGYTPLDTLALLRKSAITNTEGAYSFNNIDSGTYALEVINHQASTGLYKPIVTVTHRSKIETSDTLQHTGSVTIVLSRNTVVNGGYVYIKNSTHIGTITLDTDSTATAVINNIPLGTYAEFYYVQERTTPPELLPLTSVVIINGDTKHVTTLAYEPESSAESLSSSSEAEPLSAFTLSSSTFTLASSERHSSSSIEYFSSNNSLSSNETPKNATLNFNGEPEHLEIYGDINYDWAQYGITFETWVRWEATDSIAHLLYLSNGPDQNFPAAFSIRTVDTYYFLRYAVSNTAAEVDPPWIVEEADGVFTQGEWIHIAVSVTPAGQISFYANGELIKEVYRAMHATPVVTSRTKNYIGRSANVEARYFQGQMDNLRLWNSVRTPEEIKESIYFSTNQLLNTTQLVLSYDFEYDALHSLEVHDASGYNNTGAFKNMSGMYGPFESWLPQVDFAYEITTY